MIKEKIIENTPTNTVSSKPSLKLGQLTWFFSSPYDSLKYFILAYKEVPNDPEILSFLSFVYYKIGDLIMSEIYLQEALTLNPKNNLVNKRLQEVNKLIVEAKKYKN